MAVGLALAALVTDLLPEASALAPLADASAVGAGVAVGAGCSVGWGAVAVGADCCALGSVADVGSASAMLDVDDSLVSVAGRAAVAVATVVAATAAVEGVARGRGAVPTSVSTAVRALVSWAASGRAVAVAAAVGAAARAAVVPGADWAIGAARRGAAPLLDAARVVAAGVSAAAAARELVGTAAAVAVVPRPGVIVTRGDAALGGLLGRGGVIAAAPKALLSGPSKACRADGAAAASTLATACSGAAQPRPSSAPLRASAATPTMSNPTRLRGDSLGGRGAGVW